MAGTDVRGHLCGMTPMRRRTTVADLMTPDVMTVDAGMPYKQLACLLFVGGLTRVLVADDDGHVLGIVTAADLLHKLERRDRLEPGRLAPRGRKNRWQKSSATTASELMDTGFATIGSRATSREAAAHLLEQGVDSLVVQDADRVVGVVGQMDLLRLFLLSDEEIRHSVMHKVIGIAVGPTNDMVSVRVEDGVVTLTGRVESTSVIRTLCELTHTLDGVVSVDCRLTPAMDDDHPPRIAPTHMLF